MNICLQCSCDTINPKFCSSSCAAIYNNKNRKRTQESKEKVSNTLKQYNKDNKEKIDENRKIRVMSPYTKVNKVCYFTFCQTCGSTIRFSKRRKTCSKICLKEYLSKVQKALERTHVGNKASIKYKGISLGSTYELIVAEELDKYNIEWSRPKPIPYIDSKGISHKYYPDFYLPKYNKFLDPKNDYLINNINSYHGYSDKEKIEWVKIQNNVDIIILDKNNLIWDRIKLLV